jgi:hypothetical protein
MHRKYYDNWFDHDSDSDSKADVVAALCATVCNYKKSRRMSPIRKRLQWSQHVKRLCKEGHFTRMYRMQIGSFQKLLSFLTPYLHVNAHKGNRRSCGMGHITPKLILHCVLRYMAGVTHHDIHVLAGICKSTFFTCLHRAIDAINKCPNLALHFPSDPVALKEVAAEFPSKSSFGVLNRCIRALDGWLCRTKVPLGKDSANISSYFLGHCHCHGVNIQAVCDSRCHFTFLHVL